MVEPLFQGPGKEVTGTDFVLIQPHRDVVAEQVAPLVLGHKGLHQARQMGAVDLHFVQAIQ